MRWISRHCELVFRSLVIFFIIGAALFAAGIIAGTQLLSRNNQNMLDSSMSRNAPIADSIAGALAGDEVMVRVHDISGNLKSEQTTHNIITSAGAIWFCVQQNRCESHIANESPNVASTSSPTWWVQFISGTPNSNEPTAADCTAPSGGGDLAGQVSAGRCVVNFGVAPAQYQAGGSIVTVSSSSGAGQLRGSGTFDTTLNFVQTTEATVCSIIDDGTAPSSGTCQFTDSTPILTNLSGGTITVNGLALASGSSSSSSAGALIIAESTISAVTLAPGDTISVSWTIVT
jgi:hypothetical protein